MGSDAGEEGGHEFSSKMPRTMSNLPDFPRRPFLYAHLCFNTKSMTLLNTGESTKGERNYNSHEATCKDENCTLL